VKHCRLPDGTRIAAAGRLECRFLHREIFVDRVYAAGAIPPGGCVVDVGANIGLFALWAARHLEPVRMLLFEPIPETFRALEENGSRHFPHAERHNVGFARESGTATFLYYPGAAGWASLKRREPLLRESLLAWLRRGSLGPPVKAFQMLGRVSPRIQRALHDRVCDRIFAAGEELRCPVISLSDAIEQYRVDRIDLLKLDVEGAELEVFQGVRGEHWPRIHRVTAEVEDVDGSLDACVDLLARHGLRVRTRQAAQMVNTPFHHLWADRSTRLAGSR
jgi:FkbM family methyltransferase